VGSPRAAEDAVAAAVGAAKAAAAIVTAATKVARKARVGRGRGRGAEEAQAGEEGFLRSWVGGAARRPERHQVVALEEVPAEAVVVAEEPAGAEEEAARRVRSPLVRASSAQWDLRLC
jgi:hypothetical protein